MLNYRFEAQAIVNEEWYGDGPPHWDDAPTALDAWKDREAAAKRLRRRPFPTWFPGALELSNKLSACAPNIRCGSGACPECMRAVQRVLTAHIVERTTMDVKDTSEDDAEDDGES